MVLSIELTDTHAYVVEAAGLGYPLQIRRQLTVNLPEDAVSQGLVTDVEAVAGALSMALKKAGITARAAMMCASSPAIMLRETEAPWGTDAQIRLALREGMDEALRERQDLLMDYVVLERNGETCRAMLFVMPKALVESYRAVLARCNLKPLGLEVSANAAFKLVHHCPNLCEPGAVILAKVDAGEVQMCLVNGDSRFFSRSVSISAQMGQANEFILSSLHTLPEVEDLSIQDDVLRTVSENLSRLAQYQNIRNSQRPVARVWLASSLPDPERLAQRLEDATGLPTAVLGLCEGVAGQAASVGRYVYAVGALLRK